MTENKYLFKLIRHPVCLSSSAEVDDINLHEALLPFLDYPARQLMPEGRALHKYTNTQRYTPTTTEAVKVVFI